MAAAGAVAAAVVAVDIHDCLFVCIGDGGDSGDGGYTRWLLDCWMTNLQIESCADELPAHVGVRHRTFIVNTDTCDRGGSHWVAFHFPSWDPPNFSIRWETHRKRITAVSPTSTDRNTTTTQIQPDNTDTCRLHFL